MMNNRGYTYAGTLMVILIISSAYFILMFGGFYGDTKMTYESKEIVSDMVSDLNSKERIHALLSSNVSYMGDTTYDDLGKNYKVTTVNEKIERKSVSAGHMSSFYVNNKTDVAVDLYASPPGGQQSCSYSISILNGTYDLLGGQGANLSSSTGFLINGEKLYNSVTNETHYGDYVVNIVGDCMVYGTIAYDKLAERTVNLETPAYVREVLITNENNLPKVKFN